MGDLEKILTLAREQIGVTEQPPGSNNVIYNTDYYGGAVQGANYPWCCVFIWWLFRETGLSGLFCGGQKTAWCPFVVNYAREHGQWVTGDYKPGDLFLFDWDGDGQADHIGICESWFGAWGYAVEGNAGDSVKLAARYPQQIMGAYRPAYGEEKEKDPSAAQPREQGTASLGTPRGEYAGRQDDRTYTVRSGDTLWGIAETQMGSGLLYEQLRLANGLDGYLIHPGQQLVIPVQRVSEANAAKGAESGTDREKIITLLRSAIAALSESRSLLEELWKEEVS